MSYRILIVEDDVITRVPVSEWLQQRGYTVYEAFDGREGLRLFKDASPDIVLLDLNIPYYSGLEVLKQIRMQDADLPVIIVSGTDRVKDVVNAFKAGASDYIQKPLVSFDLLFNILQKAEERKKLQDAVVRGKERYYHLVQQIPFIIFSMREDFTFDFINDSSMRIVGYEPDEIVNSPDWFLTSLFPEDVKPVRENLIACFQGHKKEIVLDFRFKHKLGYYVFLQLNIFRARAHASKKKSKYLEGFFLDMTEHNMLDQLLLQREKLNTLGAISAELAHEIRNPLVALGGYARRLRKRYPESHEASIVLQEATRLEQLLNRIQSYLAPVDVALQACEVNGLIGFCLDLLLKSKRLENCPIAFDLAPEELLAKSDKEILTQVFLNFLGLALDGIEKMGEAHVRTLRKTNFIETRVALTPFDLRIQNPEMLFFPFESDELSFSLALSYRHLESVGGWIDFERRGETALFFIRLPFWEDPQPPLTQAEPKG